MLKPQTMSREVLLANYRRGTFKFVKVGWLYRFSDATWRGFQHRDMVAVGEQAQAAGFINLERTGWSMGKQWSDSCQIGCGEVEIAELTKLLAPLSFNGTGAINAIQGPPV